MFSLDADFVSGTSSFPMKPFDLELWCSNIPEAPKEAQL
jgi:hypothetical protein